MMMKTLATPQQANHWASLCGKLLSLLLVVLAVHAPAGPLVTTDSPIGFFTNISSRLLSAQMGLDLNHIQVYPTNQYTPAVHRVLQVTANLYDAVTNRPFAGDYPFLPTVFRPLFRRETNGAIFIAGYREVTNDAVADFTGPGLNTVVLGFNNSTIPLSGTPFGLDEGFEPLVTGIPLVIGAKKGLPNFNEFGAQTSMQVSRKLQFCRPPGSNTGPIVETNQMYVASITNTCGVEVWNSSVSSYPRNLELRLDAVMVAIVTNQYGMPLVSNAVPLRPASAAVASNTWPGFTSRSSPVSFKALLNGCLFLTNSAYSELQGAFVPPSDFERGLGLPVHQWFLNLRSMLRFALVDTSVSPARIVDYVSLDALQGPMDLTTLLMAESGSGFYFAPCMGAQYWTPSFTAGSMWCTNREGGSLFTPTFGILNQIGYCMDERRGAPQVITASQANFFLHQFYPQAGNVGGDQDTYSLTNTFYAPYSAMRLINLYSRWQANDPLVHYTIADLTDSLGHPPTLELDMTVSSPFSELGGLDFFTAQPVGSATPLNIHYRPWGGFSGGSETTPATNWRLELKDPLVYCSDNWDFPTNQLPDLSWIGRVHRGTPWQTIYLKSSAIDLMTWTNWTGDCQIAGPGFLGTPPTYDAAYTYPTNDWHLASLLISLLSTNDPRTLLSVNEPSVPAWTSALDGIVALTNTASDQALRYGAQFAPVLVQSNSPQALELASAIATGRGSQAGQRFGEGGNILAVPELSVASPFLNQGSRTHWPNYYTYQQTYGLSDAAYEAIPSQLLLRLRPDSVASIVRGPGPMQVQFTGADGYRYAVEVSSNLVDWVGVSTNYPSNGCFLFQESQPAPASRRFYRSSLLP